MCKSCMPGCRDRLICITSRIEYIKIRRFLIENTGLLDYNRNQTISEVSNTWQSFAATT